MLTIQSQTHTNKRKFRNVGNAARTRGGRCIEKFTMCLVYREDGTQGDECTRQKCISRKGERTVSVLYQVGRYSTLVRVKVMDVSRKIK